VALAKLAGLHPEVKAAAELCLSWAKYYGLDVTVTSGHRDLAKQTELRRQYENCIARGETVWPGNPNPACRYPANRPGDSAHNYGMAFDSTVPAGQQWAWDYLRRYAGFRVPENDLIHAEVPEWRHFV
jgi:hypothetical protein